LATRSSLLLNTENGTPDPPGWAKPVGLKSGWCFFIRPGGLKKPDGSGTVGFSFLVHHWVFSVHYSFDVQNFEHRTPINSLSAYGVKR
jgi:hypothetical protein